MATKKEKREAFFATLLAEPKLTSESNIHSLIESDNNNDTPISDMVQAMNKDITLKAVYEASADTFESYPDEKIRLQLHSGEKRKAMKESILQDGILEPVLVWQKNDRKIVLAGHNRVDIAKELGIKVPYIVMDDVSKRQADRIVVITNLQNRQYTEMKPSELSNMLNILISSYEDIVPMNDVLQDIDQDFNLSKNKVYQYLSYQKLNKGLLEMLDAGKIPARVAYPLSNLSEAKQDLLFHFTQEHNLSISLKIFDKLQTRTGEWDEEFLMLAFGLKNDKKIGRGRYKQKFTLKYDDYVKYLEVNDFNNLPKVVEKSLETRYQIKEVAKKYNVEIDTSLVLKAVEEYLSKN